MIYRAILILALLVGWPQMVNAADSFDGLVTVTPSKLEIIGNPGEIIKQEFTLTNNSADSLNLTLRFEDFSTVREEDLPSVPSLVPYLSALQRDFVLLPGDQITVPIKVTLPAEMSPGGFYGLAVFSIASTGVGETMNTQLVTRLAPLLFLRVRGEVTESGSLRDFNLLGRRWHFSSVPITFYLTYQNTGNIYLNPYGVMELENQLTGKIKTFQIDPWFVLPGTTRIREITINDKLTAGWYEARLALNRGFSDEIDARTINFVVFSPLIFWLIILILAIGLIIIVKRLRKIFFVIIFIVALTNLTGAQVASSPNYRLQADSLNFGGGLSTSGNYGLESTLGEVGTGNLTSTNYGLLTGYQQMISSTLAITAPSNVTLNDITGAGVSNGSTAWTVTTDNPAGYTLSIKAGSNPALASGGESFTDYSPGGAVPDYNWSVGASASAFGFSPEGADTVSRYLDNNSSCGVGASNTSDQCWDGFSTTNRTIAQGSAGNTPSGVATTVKLRAEVGANKIQATATYSATLTATATAR